MAIPWQLAEAASITKKRSDKLAVFQMLTQFCFLPMRHS